MTHSRISSSSLLAVSLGCLALTSLVPGVALAQDQAPPEPVPMGAETPSGSAPGFVTMDRGDRGSFADFSLGTSLFGDNGPDSALRAEVYGQYVTPSGTGGYGTLTMSYLSFNDDSETAIGNLELGGLHNLRLNPMTELVLRGGISLPTAGDSQESIITNYANIYTRLTDFVNFAPEVTTLRLAASPIHRSGNLFLRADGGLDLIVSEPEGSDTDPLVRLNLGAGFNAGTVAVMAEFIAVGTTGDVGDGEDRFIHAMTLSARTNLGAQELFGALIIPTNSDDFLDVSLALMIGLRSNFGP